MQLGPRFQFIFISNGAIIAMERLSSQDFSRINYTEPIKILIVDNEQGWIRCTERYSTDR